MGEARYSQDKVTVYPGVRLGKDVLIHDFCVIGLPPRGSQPGERETVIGDGAVIRPFTTIYGGVDIGKNFQAGQGVSIREDNVIGDDSSVGTQSILEIGNRIGRAFSRSETGSATTCGSTACPPWSTPPSKITP
jgi:UDP-3-O-[3-hydroxymyristoyl] glucosamine N-acyltransferase